MQAIRTLDMASIVHLSLDISETMLLISYMREIRLLTLTKRVLH
jgi:hypothetical protein